MEGFAWSSLILVGLGAGVLTVLLVGAAGTFARKWEARRREHIARNRRDTCHIVQ